MVRLAAQYQVRRRSGKDFRSNFASLCRLQFLGAEFLMNSFDFEVYAFPGCEGRAASSSSYRVNSFSLDQLRLATTQTLGLDEVPEVAKRVVDLPEADEQALSSDEPETKAKVGIPYLNL